MISALGMRNVLGMSPPACGLHRGWLPTRHRPARVCDTSTASAHVSEPAGTSSWPGRSRGSASRATSTTSTSSGPGSSAGTPAWTGRCRPGWCRGSPSGSRSSRRTTRRLPDVRDHAAATSSRRGPCSSCTAAAYMAPIDPFHVRYAARLARRCDARVVLPDYPLAPEHTWRDSFDPMTDLAERWAKEPGGTGARTATPRAAATRWRSPSRCGTAAAPQPTHLLLHAPWVDLTTSTPETVEVSRRSTRGCSSASSMRTPSGGPARPTTSAGPRSARRWPTCPVCRRR